MSTKRPCNTNPSGSNNLAETPDPVGGQAVVEGVMMRQGERWAVAVREPDGTIHTQVHDTNIKTDGMRKLPVVRGAFALYDSLRLGGKALFLSAERQLDNKTTPGGFKVATVAAILVFSTLFITLPLVVVHFITARITWLPFVLVESVVRVACVLGYVFLITQMNSIQRVFAYHGAEHQTIFCVEAGLGLTAENAKKFSVKHPRCGTAFLLWILLAAVVVYAFVPTGNFGVTVLSRLVGLPLIAGLAYEVIKFTGKHQDNKLVQVAAKPGLWLQNLTTSMPDDEQLNVAIAAIEALQEDAVKRGDNPTDSSEKPGGNVQEIPVAV